MKNNTENSKYSTAAGRWAGVGPYYAMFPVNFAISVINEYTNPGDYVLDPFAGRATSLFAAETQGRSSLGIEINPVGWVYGKAKLQTANRDLVEKRIRWIGAKAKDYCDSAKQLPEFFQYCFCPEVQEFLLAARSLLDWRRKKVDWTTMALLMIDLHGKKEISLSNQMRQTKAMSPQYAIEWWKEHDLNPPEINPVEFMLKKLQWRYAKGCPNNHSGSLYLGDSQFILKRLRTSFYFKKAKLLLTSPPYYGVTNYFYDQWLRLWLLGGTIKPTCQDDPRKSKFENKKYYKDMLLYVFKNSQYLMTDDAIVFVRTDTRQFTKEATIEALESAFPHKKIHKEIHSSPTFNQTRLFDKKSITKGEIDFVMW